MSATLKQATQRLDGETFGQLTDALVRSETQSVMLSVHGERGVGGVFVDEGRIAWAAAPGTRAFLSDRLIAAGADRAQMSELLAEARKRAMPLGQLVVERGLMHAADFAEVLFEHTVVSLGDMASQRVEKIDHHTRRGGTFAMAVTFPMEPLLAETVRRLVPVTPHEPRTSTGEQLTAIEISVVDGQPLPVRVLGSREPSLSELRSLAVEGMSVMRHVGEDTVSFRRGDKCWSVSGNQSSFVVSEGRSLFSFAWMVGQSGR
ncbi:MAG: hypothetical protein ACO1OB_34840 [Archangium sp.]